jgi:hypothetical protein
MHDVYDDIFLTAPFRKGFIVMYGVAVSGSPGPTANLNCVHLQLVRTDILTIRHILPVNLFPLLHCFTSFEDNFY